MSQKKKSKLFHKDNLYEGKDDLYLDVDRFINEGMSGGSVHCREDSTNIDQALPIPEQEKPPHSPDS